ncbi:class I SAM-dependent methyltransferase [Flexibacterium corallicola]|uniref:class I SAM-dependent methyltransferase n=1 Tax=Flexibacterium corallicola TaxID=3037259 RepID=UPI00286F8881|nr:methyltransferase domain-containing protein [Pseudovibrio sp. M1P-2-3]
MDDHRLFDKPLLAQRRRTILQKNIDGADFLLKATIQDFAERLQFVSRQFEIGIDLGAHSADVTQTLRESGKVQTVLRADLFDPLPNASAPHMVVDDQSPPLAPESVDLIVSLLNLQVVDDLPGTLAQIRRCLRPDGLFLATVFGSGTLAELRDSLLHAEMELSGGISPRVIPFAETRDLGSLLQRAGFTLPVTDVDRVTVRYNTMFDLMKDLREMGAANPLLARQKHFTSKQLFMKAAQYYAQNYSDPDGRIRATFTFTSLSGWAPHESQQKPLKPGSAKVNLADALGAKEIKI